jgi:hypothetical protein
MEYQKYYRDTNESQRLREENKHLIKMKQCYDNVWNVFIESQSSFNPDLQIAYGYVYTGVQNIYAKHCFFFDGKSVIDVTLDKDDISREYYIVKTYTQKEYIKNILISEYTDLFNYKPLRNEFEKFYQFARINNIFCCG